MSTSSTRNKMKDQISLLKSSRTLPLNNDIQDFKVRLNEIIKGYEPKIKVLFLETMHSRTRQSRDDERIHCPVIIVFCESTTKQQIKAILWKHFLLNGEVLKMFLTFLGKYSTLNSLRFEDTNFGDDDIVLLADFLRDNQNVTDLNISGNAYSKSFKCLIQDSKLKYLSLKFCGITSIDLEEFIEPLQNPYKSTLLHLNLSNNNIEDEGARTLGKILRVNRILISLNISANGITDKGAREILKSLQMFSLEQDEISIRRKIHYGYYMMKWEEIFAHFSMTSGGGNVTSSSSSTRLKNKTKFTKMRVRRLSRSAVSSSQLSFTPRELPLTMGQDPHIMLPLAEAEDLKTTLDFDLAYHPFVNDTTVDGYKFMCRGNLVLTRLNMSFNKLTGGILEDVREVLKYQSTCRSDDEGLRSIGLYGNHLRTEDYLFGALSEVSETLTKRTSKSASSGSIVSRDTRRKTKTTRIG